jgi:hypothetical protein
MSAIFFFGFDGVAVGRDHSQPRRTAVGCQFHLAQLSVLIMRSIWRPNSQSLPTQTTGPSLARHNRLRALAES